MARKQDFVVDFVRLAKPKIVWDLGCNTGDYAAVALGATRWEMIRGAVIPWSRGGIMGAVLLGLGRAMGETIAVALVIGNSARITGNIFGPGDAMAGLIANQWGEASDLHRAALIGLGVALFMITIIVNLLAQRIIQRFEVD